MKSQAQRDKDFRKKTLEGLPEELRRDCKPLIALLSAPNPEGPEDPLVQKLWARDGVIYSTDRHRAYGAKVGHKATLIKDWDKTFESIIQPDFNARSQHWDAKTSEKYLAECRKTLAQAKAQRKEALEAKKLRYQELEAKYAKDTADLDEWLTRSFKTKLAADRANALAEYRGTVQKSDLTAILAGDTVIAFNTVYLRDALAFLGKGPLSVSYTEALAVVVFQTDDKVVYLMPVRA